MAIFLSKDNSQTVRNEFLDLDRIRMVQLQTTTININIVQVYPPTQNFDDEYIDNICNDFERVLSLNKKRDL